MIKGILLILICLASSYLGIKKAKTYSDRVDNLKKFQNALNLLKSKIEFTHEPIKQIFDDISKVVYADKNNIFRDVIIDSSFYCNWCNSIENSMENFTNEDKEIMKVFGKQLRKNRY